MKFTHTFSWQLQSLTLLSLLSPQSNQPSPPSNISNYRFPVSVWSKIALTLWRHVSLTSSHIVMVFVRRLELTDAQQSRDERSALQSLVAAH